MKKYKSGGDLKSVPADKKGLAKLPTEVRNKMGYMKNGGEKMLNKMTYGGGSMDMSDVMVKRMQVGGSTANTYSRPIKKAQMGGEKTKDSTAIFQNKAKDMARKSLYAESKGDKKLSDIYIEVASKASSDAARQKLKGKPGYDKNGYAIKKMGGSITKTYSGPKKKK